MFDFLKAKMGGAKLGERAQAALEKVVLNSPTMRKIEKEFEPEQAADRTRLLAALAALDQEEAGTMGGLANKLQGFAAEWQEREAELRRFSAEWLQTSQQAAGQSHLFHRRRHLLLRQIAELLPDGIEAAAVELEDRWRAYGEEAIRSPLHDAEVFRDRDSAFRAVVRAVRDLVTCPAEKIAERLLTLKKRADKLLAADPPRHAPVDARALGFNPLSSEPGFASCSNPDRQAGNWK